MLEVMIAILTITAFSIGTLQFMAFTALYKVRAERQAQANFWIQEDFEDVKYLASSLAFDEKWCTGEEGYATALRGQLTATPIPDQTIVGKNYSLSRTFPDDDEAQSAYPHRLRIDYQVQNQENDVIARSSVEVIPDASFKCR
ncbi:MAG: type 4 pilin [Microcystis flos-aquae TF09]|uniref:Type 4 pilin n=1 Tax=Microcystis flos-aquae TF09 TaxID=2060473 RepID=A0A3E0KYN0_9CHRO|nr:MAG: type 4 pilin [Microcystis flos-aquae TF09]